MARLRVSYDIEIADEQLDQDRNGVLDDATRALAIAKAQAALALPDASVMFFVLCGEEFLLGYPTHCTKDRGHDGDHGTMNS